MKATLLITILSFFYISSIAQTWQLAKSIPESTVPYAATINGKIYVVAAGNPANYLSTYEYNPELDTWTKKGSLQTIRSTLDLAVSGDKMYAIGGFSNSGEFNKLTNSSYFEEFDINTGLWTKKKDLPVAVNWITSAALNKKIYVFGGFIRTFSGGNSKDSVTNTVFEYDPETDNWTAKQPMQKARANAAVAVLNNEIFILGGSNTIKGFWYDSYAVNGIESFNPENNVWTSKANYKELSGLALIQCVIINGKIYTISTDGQKHAIMSYIEEYNPLTDTWTEKLQIPTYIDYGKCMGREQLIICGGRLNNETASQKALKYDPNTNVLTYLPDLSETKECPATIFLNDKVYVLGGATSKGLTNKT